MDNEVGSKLKKARLDKGLTLQQVADSVGCSPSYVQRIESGSRKEISYQIYNKLNDILEFQNPKSLSSREKRSELEELIKSSREAKLKVLSTTKSAFEAINTMLDDMIAIEEELDEKISNIIMD